MNAQPWSPGTPCWLELELEDTARGMEFYRQVLRWTFADQDHKKPVDVHDPTGLDLAVGSSGTNYHLAAFRGRRVAAIIERPASAPAAPTSWTVSFATTNAGDTATQLAQAGARTLTSPTAVGDLGIRATWCTPGGEPFGLWQAGSHPGFDARAEPGVVWVELCCSDPPATKTFFASAFGFTYVASAPHNDHFFPRGDATPRGGIRPAFEELDAFVGWNPMFTVPDVDIAVTKTKALGGSVPFAPVTSDHGKMCLVRGVENELMCLFQPR